MPIPETEPLTPDTVLAGEAETVEGKVDEGVIKEPRKKSIVVSILLVLVGILVVSTAVFAALYFKVVELPPFLTLAPASPIPSVLPSPPLLPSNSPIVKSDIVWLTQPEEIASIQLTKPQEELASDYSYYLTNRTEYRVVGTMKDGTKIVSMTVPCEGMMCDLIVYCLMTDAKTECLNSGLNEYDIKTVPELLKNTIPFKSTEVVGVTAPKTLTVKGVTLRLVGRNGEKLTDIPKAELYEETKYGKLYRGLTPLLDSSDLVARNFYLMLGDGSLFTYSYNEKPYEVELGRGLVPQWTNGATSSDSLTQSLASGCGSSMWGSVPIYRGNVANIVAVAKAAYGDILYQTDTTRDATLVYALYQFYKQGRSETDPNLLTSDQFLAKKDVYVLWKDTLGDWQIFMSDAYAPMVECGKPVIYLYPTQTMPVSVEVGAVIRKSEPTYPTQGWNVVAEPSGKLTYLQQTYPYLFWEGKGWGFYPDFRDHGVIVGQNRVVSTLYQHMTTLGLNAQEQADFMEFWQPRLPKTPYVRLTWLGTREMDVLAPLTVSPKPDTVIRVFLEFEGLNQLKAVQPQFLTTPTRKGFTLVEWGGLLVGETE